MIVEWASWGNGEDDGCYRVGRDLVVVHTIVGGETECRMGMGHCCVDSGKGVGLYSTHTSVMHHPMQDHAPCNIACHAGRR